MIRIGRYAPARIAVWQALSSVPAVRDGRVYFIDQQLTVIPVRASPKPSSSSPERFTRGLQVKILVSWSSGKDSAWMLHVLRTEGIGEPERC